MRNIIAVIAMWIPFCVVGQGIKFEQKDNWHDVVKSAKAEHKYIFVDCYATWCQPCKTMDSKVYPSEKIGNVVNEKFISIKLQFDSTGGDNETTRRWYEQAKKFINDYKVSAFPSYLFFDQNGEVVHKEIGYRNEKDFLQLVEGALDTAKQIYTRINRYSNGPKDYPAMPELVASVRTILKDKNLASLIAQDYLHNYLYRLPEDQILKKENIDFILANISSASEYGFKLFQTRSVKIDSFERAGYSKLAIDIIISKEEIDSKIYKDGKAIIDNPQWQVYRASIAQKHGREIADRLVLNAQAYWFHAYKKDWDKATSLYIEKFDRYGLDTAGGAWKNFNNVFWDFFLHTNDKAKLRKAIQWMAVINDQHPNSIIDLDTYANLIYKSGDVAKAMDVERKAMDIEEKNAAAEKRKPDPIYRETLEKMKKGEPTWVTPGTSGSLSKPVIDSSSYSIWPSLSQGKLSDDGKYVSYLINLGTSRLKPLKDFSDTLVFVSSDNKWKRRFLSASNPTFTADSKFGVFSKKNDSLGVLTLGSDSVQYLTNISSFKLASKNATPWLVYKIKENNKVFIMNLSSKRITALGNLLGFDFTPDESGLMIREQVGGGQSLSVYTFLKDEKREVIFFPFKTSELTIGRFIFDKLGKQMAFTSTVSNKITVWYCPSISEKPTILLDSSDPFKDSNKTSIANLYRFTNDGERILFSIRESEKSDVMVSSLKLNVWSYLDSKIQPSQVNSYNKETYLSIVDIKSHRIIRLQYSNERIDYSPYFIPSEQADTLGFIYKYAGDPNDEEKPWNRLSRFSFFIINTKTGERVNVRELQKSSIVIRRLSTSERYIFFDNNEDGKLYVFDIAMKRCRCITKNIKNDWSSGRDDVYTTSNQPLFWLSNDTALIIKDQFDIWQLDPKAVAAPINLTGGYGSKNKISFNFVFNDKSLFGTERRAVLEGFNVTTKENGFFELRLGGRQLPKPLTFGAYYFHSDIEKGFDVAVPRPGKAKADKMFLVQKSMSIATPNYFTTPDFITFTEVSHVYPEKQYNWLTTELHQYQSKSGQLLQGVLFKPENFDSTKKHPLIFYYYEKYANVLNIYQQPQLSEGEINIPSYVSNGYLVFCPDINYKIGDPGGSAVECVLAAANHLTQLPFVNKDRMGLQGISYGSFETNSIIAHSTLFRAACSSSGYCDQIGLSNGLFINRNAQIYVETGQGRMGVGMWDRPDLYLRNSPIFFLDRVQTPVLLYLGDHDQPNSPQLKELFLGLRRLGKKAWMLEYEDEGHGIFGQAAKIDFTLRMKQFFDHYLKDAPAPVWMTQGISASNKGKKLGLEYDLSIKTPGVGLTESNTDHLNSRQKELLKKKTMVTLDGTVVNKLHL
jgi:thioredoxin-related protein/dienelactone hydrolase